MTSTPSTIGVSTARSSIVVTGDVVIDHHLYKGERHAPTDDHKRGVLHYCEWGGAALLHRTLAELVAQGSQKAWDVHLGLELPDAAANPDGHHAYAVWKRDATTRAGEKTEVWRLDDAMGYGASWPAAQSPCPAGLPPDIVVLDDAGAEFRRLDRKDLWQLPKKGKKKPAWIVLKMSRPVGQGDLWRGLVGFADRLVCVVSADELRQECVGISQGLSWERTVEEVRDALKSNSTLKQLQRCRHLIVTFAADGALWVDNPGARVPSAVLVFDAAGAEREGSSKTMTGSSPPFVAAVCLALMRHLKPKDAAALARDAGAFKTGVAAWATDAGKLSTTSGTLEKAAGALTARTVMANAGKLAKDAAAWAKGSTTLTKSADALRIGADTLARDADAVTKEIEARAKRGSTPAPLDLSPAIEAGLAAVRDLFELGHGKVGKNEKPAGYPAARLAEVILKPMDMFARAVVPWSRDSGAWTIIEESMHALGSDTRPSLVGLGRQVVLQGQPALKRLPHAVFGKLTTADRSEIEALRNVKRLMLGYRTEAKADKPLSIGVFGPPGAGKSFGVKQIAAELFGEKAWLEFNLSQFNGATDLVGAFHQVRDRVLGGETPVVFWDEFDSREYEWLQYLLAPMQDGRFQAGQLNHAIGKCVFVFAGGTSPTFEEFGPFVGDPSARNVRHRPTDEEKKALHEFKLRKGPDFKSRLDAYLNVIGPNRRTKPRNAQTRNSRPQPDESDVCPPLRRALFIRSKLAGGPADRLDFDSDLLDALLQVSEYKNGSRSLEKLILPLKSAAGKPIRRSSLPAPSQLAMHVEPAEFKDILDRNAGFKMSGCIERLAAVIHETWRALSKKEGWKMQDNYAMPYAQLGDVEKEDNRAAARRIPEILALAGMGIADTNKVALRDRLSAKTIRDHLEHHLGRLAEAEHDGWMDQRLRNGWRLGDRDDVKRLHPALLPYDQLPQFEKDKDRHSILKMPKMVADARYRIIWLKDNGRSKASL